MPLHHWAWDGEDRQTRQEGRQKVLPRDKNLLKIRHPVYPSPSPLRWEMPRGCC